MATSHQIITLSNAKIMVIYISYNLVVKRLISYYLYHDGMLTLSSPTKYTHPAVAIPSATWAITSAI